MSGAKAKAVLGNPVLPPPPIPKKVLESNVKPTPTQAEEPKPSSILERAEEKVGEKVRVEVDEKPKGTITIYVYNGKPYEAKFEGEIAGFEMNIAIPAMRKQYKLWKHGLLKQGGK